MSMITYCCVCCVCVCVLCCFFQAEDGIRDLVRSRGLGDVYKRQGHLEDRPLTRVIVVGERRRCDGDDLVKGRLRERVADHSFHSVDVTLSLIHI